MAIDLIDLQKKLPGEVNGWKKSPGYVEYTPKNLYNYIDGGAELYISYQFRSMVALEYQKEDLPAITVDIFDMQNSYNAFGVFAHSRESVDHTIGPGIESEYGGGLLTFWRGAYYVSIMGYPESEEKNAVLLAIGRAIAALAPGEDMKPPLIQRLPQQDLREESIRYFRHHAWLNSHYFIADQDILLIDDGGEAVLARYRYQNGEAVETYLVLLVAYPNQEKAAAARQNFMTGYLPDAPPSTGIKQLEDGRWTGCRVTGSIVTAVFAAPNEEILKKVLQEVQ